MQLGQNPLKSSKIRAIITLKKKLLECDIMRYKNDLGALDIFRIIAAALVVVIHAPSADGTLNLIFKGAVARIAVPFFFAVTGMFTDFQSAENVKRLVSKTLVLYIAATAVYLPYGAYSSSVKAMLFDGTFYHLWYFPAVMIGAVIVYALYKLPRSSVFVIASALYIFGLCGDSYAGLTRNIPAINAVADFFSGIFSFTRNGLFFAPIFLMIGNIVGEKIKPPRRKNGVKVYAPCLVISLAALILERLALRDIAVGMLSNMFISLVPCTVFLLLTLTSVKVKPRPNLRTVSMWIYIIHPIIIDLINRLSNGYDISSGTLSADAKSTVYKAVVALSIAAIAAVLLSKKKHGNRRVIVT